MEFDFERRPLVVAIAGPNGAGKSTFFERVIKPSGLQFVNADVLALEGNLDPYEAAKLAERLREQLTAQRASFAFETVLSDPVGEKVDFLRRLAGEGYTVILCFIGLDSPVRSDERVALRVTRGGHDVPTDKLTARYPRTLDNLGRALDHLPHVLVYDNSDFAQPYRFIAEYRDGAPMRASDELPAWFRQVLERRQA